MEVASSSIFLSKPMRVKKRPPDGGGVIVMWAKFGWWGIGH